MQSYKPSPEFLEFVHCTVLGKIPNMTLALEGPAGCGKTVATRAIHSLLMQAKPEVYKPENYLRYVCNKETSFVDFTVDKTLKNGNLDEVESRFLQLIQLPSVVVVDEYGLAQPDVLAGLNDFLDYDQAKVLPNGKLYKRHPDNVLVFTSNPRTYAGVKRQHGGFMDRLPTFFMGYSKEEAAILKNKYPEVKEETILKATKFAEMVRNAQKTKNLQTLCSTRGLEMFVNLIHNGANLTTALRACFKPAMEEDVIINEFCRMAFQATIIEDKDGNKEVDISGGTKAENEKLKTTNADLKKKMKKLEQQLEDALAETA